MIDFMSGALTFTYVVTALYFLQFWRRAGDRLFLMFAFAFGLLAANQATLFVIGSTDELGEYTYLLRVLAFTLILLGIVYKNASRRRAGPHDAKAAVRNSDAGRSYR